MTKHTAPDPTRLRSYLYPAAVISIGAVAILVFSAVVGAIAVLIGIAELVILLVRLVLQRRRAR